ncbi:hypothetical protein D3C71_1658140 [compost metagenome]
MLQAQRASIQRRHTAENLPLLHAQVFAHYSVQPFDSGLAVRHFCDHAEGTAQPGWVGLEYQGLGYGQPRIPSGLRGKELCVVVRGKELGSVGQSHDQPTLLPRRVGIATPSGAGSSARHQSHAPDLRMQTPAIAQIARQPRFDIGHADDTRCHSAIDAFLWLHQAATGSPMRYRTGSDFRPPTKLAWT